MIACLRTLTLASLLAPGLAGATPCPPPAASPEKVGSCRSGWTYDTRGCCMPEGAPVEVRAVRADALKSPLAEQAPPRLGLRFISLPGGPTFTGVGDDPEFDLPDWVVPVAPFEIGRTEVTVAQYGACVRAGVCAEPSAEEASKEGQPIKLAEDCNWGHPSRAQLPINCVSRAQAARFAAWAGARLPTEIEWVHAARGGGRQVSPWADKRSDASEQTGFWYISGLAAPVCSYRTTHSVQGVCDLVNNVSEIVVQPLFRCDPDEQDCQGLAAAEPPASPGEAPAPAAEAPATGVVEPPGPLARGGHYWDDSAKVTDDEPGPDEPSPLIGFRLARCRPAPTGRRAGSKTKATSACSCEAGQITVTAGAVSACCWPGQSWSWQESTCVGAPRCPDGMSLQAFDALSGQRLPAPVCVTQVAIEAGMAERRRRAASGEAFAKTLTWLPVAGGELTAAPITVGQYAACVKADACTPRLPVEGAPRCETAPDSVANCVGYKQAQAFARWLGGEIPSAEVLQGIEPAPERPEPVAAAGRKPPAVAPCMVVPTKDNLALWTHEAGAERGNEVRTHQTRWVVTVGSGERESAVSATVTVLVVASISSRACVSVTLSTRPT